MTDRAALSQKRSALLAATGIGLGLALPAFIIGRAALALCLVLALIGAFVLFRPAIFAAWRAFAQAREGRVLIAIALVFLLPVILSRDSVASLEIWIRTVVTLPLGLALLAVMREDARVRLITLKALVGGFLAAVIAAVYFQYLDEASLVAFGDWVGRPIDPKAQFLPLAAILACFAPIFVWVATQFQGAWRWASLLILPFIPLIIWAKGEQSNLAAIAGLLGGVLCLAIVWVGVRLPIWARWFGFGGLILIGSLGAVVLLELLPDKTDVTGAGLRLPLIDLHRQLIWAFTYDVIQHHWLVGVGLDTVGTMPGAQVVIPGLNQEFIPSHPHNWALEIASEAGVIGLIAALLALTTAFLMAVRERQHGAAWAILFMLAVYWTSGLANFSVWSSWWQTVLVIGLIIPWASIPRKSDL